MSLLLTAAVLAFAGITTVTVSETRNRTTVINPLDNNLKTMVRINSLPSIIKATLSSNKYKNWAPIAAYLVIDSNNAEYYQVDVKNEEETTSLKINKDGTI